MNELLSFFVNYGSLVAYLAISVDLLMQIIRVYKRKSSLDISWKGILFRMLGGLVILIKFISLNDPYLILGQALFTLAVITYLFVVLRYRNARA